MEATKPPGTPPDLHVVTTPNMQAGGRVPRRVMGKRYVRVTIDSPDYPDFQAEVWVNVPDSYLSDMAGWTKDLKDVDEAGISDAEKAERQAALDAVERRMAARYHEVIRWTNFVDFEGNDFPPTDDPAFFKAISQDLMAIVMQERQKHVGKLTPPKSGR